MSDRDPETGEHTPMDAGAWRARALRAERHCDALEVDRLIHQRDRAERRAATCRAELADLRAEREALYAVVQAILVDHDQSIAPEEDEEGVKRWWKLPATRAALDALPCWCGKPDGHASGCPGG